MKILYITPHLSTGGAPQYLLKKITELIDTHDIYCIEYSNITGGVLVVQRNQIEKILGNNLITLSDNKDELIDHIKKINPDIIHLEELPEYFCDREVSKKIYTSERSYKIIETSHDSSFNISQKQFFPDSFVFVSEYQKNMFSPLSIPSYVVEYPISYKVKTNRNKSLLNLGLDPNKKHFLNVGLFTSRKNQSEIIDYARKLLDKNVQFHFVGNQADNFKSYWEPLMKSFPANCKWWGERRDVDTFYNAMDVFIFTSRGHANDKETSPLVLREAIGWNMPILMYNLPVYCGMYNKYKNITWLTNDLEDNLFIIKNFISDTVINESTEPKTTLDASVKINNLFNVKFENSNKIVFEYLSDKNIECHVVIKDVDSNIPIYNFKNIFYKNSTFWTIPIPTHVFDFEKEDTFRGFLIEIYDLSKKIITSTELYIDKNRKNDKFKFNIINPFDLLFHNYLEMFVKKNYDCYDIDNLSTVIDIGANSGLFSKLCFDKNAKQIFAIEPNINCLSNLRSIFNDENRITIINKAISDFVGTVDLYTNDDCTTLSSLYKEHANTNTCTQTVDCTTLEKIVNDYNIKQISLLKLDVEGAEYSILENLNKNIYDITDSILLEYHDNKDKRVKKLVEILESHGFSILQVRNHSKNNEDIIDNYLNIDNATIYAKKENKKELLVTDIEFLKKEVANIKGICHVGSHVGSHVGAEVEEYVKNDVDTMVWVEANYLILNKLINNTAKFGKKQYWLPFTLYNKDDIIKNFNISNNEESSSVLELREEHKKQYPHIHYNNKISVLTKRFDTYVNSQTDFNWNDINMLVVDCQGVDLQVLEGFGDLLHSPSLKIIKTEVNIGNMYEGNASEEDIVKYLSKFNFIKKYWFYTYHQWGDIVFVKN